MSKSTLKTYINNTIWPSFAKMIKARDANNDGWCTCCSCGKRIRWNEQECHAGHLVPGRSGNIIFDELLVHAQCYRCNGPLKGNVFGYQAFMRIRYGMNHLEVDELFLRANIIKKFTRPELKELKQAYDNEFKRLCSEKGLC